MVLHNKIPGTNSISVGLLNEDGSWLVFLSLIQSRRDSTGCNGGLHSSGSYGYVYTAVESIFLFGSVCEPVVVWTCVCARNAGSGPVSGVFVKVLVVPPQSLQVPHAPAAHLHPQHGLQHRLG